MFFSLFLFGKSYALLRIRGSITKKEEKQYWGEARSLAGEGGVGRQRIVASAYIQVLERTAGMCPEGEVGVLTL